MFAIVGREPHCSAGECQWLGTDKQNTPNWAQVLRDMFECVWETWAESALASEGVARLKGETKADMLLEEMNALELWFIARRVCPVPLCLFAWSRSHSVLSQHQRRLLFLANKE